MTAPLVIFDLDGTLIDTAPDLVSSLNHTISSVGLEPVTYEDLTHLVGQGVRVMIRRAFDLRKVALDETTEDMLVERYLAHYKADMPGHSKPYAGIIDCLDRLEAAGFTLAVCTNKAEQLAIPLLEKLDLARRFAAITCGDTFAYRKPDGRHIASTVERATSDMAESIMVGDSINDILAAQNAGIPSIAVTFGYSDVPVESLGASRVVSHYDQVTVNLIEQLLLAK